MSASPGEYLSFKLNNTEYGVDILKVQEIRKFEEPTKIANSDPMIVGVVNLRGVIVPLIDLRIKFSLEKVRYDEETVVIILTHEDLVTGVVVDSVTDVVNLTTKEISEMPNSGVNKETAHIIGIGTVRDNDQERLIILCEVSKLTFVEKVLNPLQTELV